MSLPDLDETTWLGAAIFNAQRVEVALYGLVPHFSHLPEVQKEKRFRELTPEKFIHGDFDELKATLGQLVKLVGHHFMLATPDFAVFYEDRNLIAHNYYRLFHTDIGRPKRQDGEAFLKEFTFRAERWFDVLMGLYYELIVSAAKQGKGPEYIATPMKEAQRKAYKEHVVKYLAARRSASAV